MSKSSVYLHGIVRFRSFIADVFHDRSRRTAGQALLMVVVAMIIILTVSLSVATRSFIGVRTTSEEASSSAAFSAAEAGIERYLKTQTSFTAPIGTSDVAVSTNAIGGTGVTQIVLNNGNPVIQDDGADVWLSTYPGYTSPYWSGTLRVYWGQTVDCASSAMEVVVVTGPVANPLANPQITRYAADPCAARAAINNIGAPSAGSILILGVTYVNHKVIVIDPSNPAILARAIPLYSNSVIAVTGDSDLPKQGAVVNSTGVSGDTQRKITVYQGYPKVPNEFFSYTMFSP